MAVLLLSRSGKWMAAMNVLMPSVSENEIAQMRQSTGTADRTQTRTIGSCCCGLDQRTDLSASTMPWRPLWNSSHSPLSRRLSEPARDVALRPFIPGAGEHLLRGAEFDEITQIPDT